MTKRVGRKRRRRKRGNYPIPLNALIIVSVKAVVIVAKLGSTYLCCPLETPLRTEAYH